MSACCGYKIHWDLALLMWLHSVRTWDMWGKHRTMKCFGIIYISAESLHYSVSEISGSKSNNRHPNHLLFLIDLNVFFSCIKTEDGLMAAEICMGYDCIWKSYPISYFYNIFLDMPPGKGRYCSSLHTIESNSHHSVAIFHILPALNPKTIYTEQAAYPAF